MRYNNRASTLFWAGFFFFIAAYLVGGVYAHASEPQLDQNFKMEEVFAEYLALAGQQRAYKNKPPAEVEGRILLLSDKLSAWMETSDIRDNVAGIKEGRKKCEALTQKLKGSAFLKERYPARLVAAIVENANRQDDIGKKANDLLRLIRDRALGAGWFFWSPPLTKEDVKGLASSVQGEYAKSERNVCARGNSTTYILRTPADVAMVKDVAQQLLQTHPLLVSEAVAAWNAPAEEAAEASLVGAP